MSLRYGLLSVNNKLEEHICPPEEKLILSDSLEECDLIDRDVPATRIWKQKYWESDYEKYIER